MVVSNDVKVVPRWVTPEEIKKGIEDRYSPKQSDILADLAKAPDIDSSGIGEHLARQFKEYGLAAFKLPDIAQYREQSFKISQKYGSEAKRAEMVEIAKKSSALDFFPPVGEKSRTIILANREIKDETVPIEGFDPRDRRVLADTFSVLERVGLEVVDHLNEWFGGTELQPFRESLHDSMQTKLGLNHLTPSEKGEDTIKPHYDYGALTMLPRASGEGLEFYHHAKDNPEESGWVRVKDLPKDVVLAQAGQILDIVTRGEFTPMLHRVRPGEENQERDSSVLFMQPSETYNLVDLKIRYPPNQISGLEAKFKEFVNESTEFTSKNFSLFMNFMRRMKEVTPGFINFFKPEKLKEVIRNYEENGLEDKVHPAFFRNESN